MPSGKSYDLREKAKDAASPYSGDKSKSPAKGAPTSPSKASAAATSSSPAKGAHAPASPTKHTTGSPARPASPPGKTAAAAGSSPSRIPIPTAGMHASSGASPTKPSSPTRQLRDQVTKEVAKFGGAIQSKVLPNHGIVPKVTTKTVVEAKSPARSPTAGSPTKPTTHQATGRPVSPSKAAPATTATAKLGVQQQPAVGKTPQKAQLTPDQIKKGLTHAGATSSPKSHSK